MLNESVYARQAVTTHKINKRTIHTQQNLDCDGSSTMCVSTCVIIRYTIMLQFETIHRLID